MSTTPVLEVRVDRLALEDAEHVGQRVLVEVRGLAGREVHLPDAHALVLEQEAVRDVSGGALSHPTAPSFG